MDCAFNMFVWLFLVFMGHWSIVSAGFFFRDDQNIKWRRFIVVPKPMLWSFPTQKKSTRVACKELWSMHGWFPCSILRGICQKEGDTEHVQAI